MSGANSLTLAWNLIANDAASPVFDRVSASADRAAASTEAAATKTSSSLKLLATGAAVAGVAFVGEAIKMAADFQRSMLLIQTQAGASAQEVRNMTPAILSLSGQVAQAPEALATSLYHVESTGLRGKAALQAVQIAAEGAAVGHADLEETTNALTATIASGMVPATENFLQVMGQLNTIVGSGDMKLSDLNEALGTGFLAQVKQYGATLTDVGAALADFGDNNIRGADAATMVRMAVQSIAKPGVNAAQALGQIGLTVAQLQSDEQTGGLNKALTDLHGHLVSSGIDASQWGAIMTDAFTKKAGGGIITLIGTYDRFETKYQEVQAGAESFAAAFAATQHTAAFQAAALKDNIEAMVTSLGTHLLPVATTTLTWINDNGVPALKGLGSGAMDVVHWIGELPGPIRDVALALGGLALANAIGLTGTLTAGVSRLGSAFSGAGGFVKGFGDEMGLQQRLAQMEATSLSEVDRALGAVSGSAARAAGSLTAAQVSMSTGKFAGWDLALSQTAASEDVLAASTSRLSGAMGALATRGAAAGKGLWAALGGGPGIAIGATIMLLPGLIDGFKKLAGNVIDATAATQQFTTSLEATNGVIDTSINKAAQQQLEQAGVVKVFQAAGISAKDAIAGIEGNAAAQQRVNDALHGYMDAAEKRQGLNSKDVTAASNAMHAYDQLTGSFSTAAQAAKYFGDTSKQAATDTAAAGQAGIDAAPGLEFAASAAGMSKDEIAAANKEWEKWIQNLSGLATDFMDPLKTYEDLLSQKQQAENQAAKDTAKSTKSGKDSWKDYVQNVSVSLSDYAQKLEDELKNEQDWQKNLVTIAQRGGVELAQQFADMGQKGADLTAQMANATDANFQRMATDMANEAAAGGSQAAQNLDTAMRVMAQIGADGASATAAGIAQELGIGADQVVTIAQQYGINLATGINPLLGALGKPGVYYASGNAGGLGFSRQMATGGVLPGYAPGVDSVLSLLSPGEGVLVPEAVVGLGGAGAIHAINATFSSRVPRFATGGFVTASDVPLPYSTAPYRIPISTAGDASMGAEYDAVTGFLNTNMNSPYIGMVSGATSQQAVQIGARMAMAAGWTGVQWNDLFNLWMRESGWNPYAVNPSSGAYGIPQSLGHGHPYNLGDSAAQIAWGLSYIAGRYGDPASAWAHEVSAGWYDNGGWLKPGWNLAYNGTGRPERVPPPNGGGGVTIQLDGPATVDLLEGRAVTIAADAFEMAHDRGAYNG